MNALKDGLTGKGVVLPAEELEALAAKRAAYAADMKPSDTYEDQLVDQVALASMRMDRAVRIEFTRRAQASGRALTSWADDRRVAAEELALKLPKKPALIARQLRQTLQGCELLIDRWRGLLRVAEAGTAWDEARRSRALDLLGVPVEDRENHPVLHDKAQADDLAALARREIEHQEGRRDGYLEEADERDRRLAETGMAFDDSPTGRRLWSYERANHNSFHRGLDELRCRQRARGAGPAPRPRPAPAVAGTIGVPPATAQERDGEADGTRSVPATGAANTTEQDGEADGTRNVPATKERPTGNRRQRRAQKALARRRG
jgi:hypothetical protein